MTHPMMHKLIDEMHNHVGKDLAIRGECLAKALDLTMRELRHLTGDAINDGMALCSHPAYGYWIALNAEELEFACQFHRSRALHELQKEAKLRRMNLADLLGQMKLNP